MGFKDVTWLFVVVVVVLSWVSLCEGYKFYVGGISGWVANPPEEYNHWAERNRFQVNDSLFFKYEKGQDSVLVVTRDNYIHCYTKSPTQNMTDGDSEFKFSRSRPFYFISGNENHCKQGQKLIVMVLVVRDRKSPPPQPAPPTPIQPAPTPESFSPTPPSTLTPVPPKSGEGKSPSGSDSTHTPAPAPNNYAARGVGGSFDLATLCLAILGVVVLLNN